MQQQSFSDGDDAVERSKWDLQRLADPATGRIPQNIRAEELQFASTLPILETTYNATSRSGAGFQYRGPVNVGGRTRGLAVDVANENIIIAGSVNGGIWRSIDGGITWNRSWALNENMAVSWIAQDQRPGHTNTWYASTGEPVGASSSGNGSAYYLGNGIYTSTDNGLTWAVIANTSSGTPHSFDNVYDLIYKVVTDNHDTSNAILYVATYGAIFRSVNGGSTWTLQKGNASGASFSYYTDVEVTSTGIVYAALSSDGPSKGIWRREISSTWTSISPPGWDAGTVERCVIGLNPSNDNQVYFLAETPNMGKRTTNYKGDPEWTSLWKYTYVSGNGTGAGGIWEDLSANIPYDSSQFGNFNSQGGYDLLVRVHPSNQNIVFIGGTNVYRSTDGFTTMNNTTAIGGYDIASTLPHYINYPNNHSDQHNLVFLPSNPDIVYQANDGGVYKSANIQANPVVWQDINNGYNTAQFYTVALDHATPGNDIIMGGTQDNGTWFTNTTNSTVPWTQPGRGDGAYCAIDNGHNFYYTSRQQGKLMKSTLDINGNTIGFNRIDPISPDSIIYKFINPFVLDPNNNNIMYWAAGNKIYRNDSLTSIPLSGNWDTISTGWYLFPDTINHAGAAVSAFGISSSPANRLYVGTDKNFIYRVDNANGPAPVMTEVTDNVNFPANAYINCIAVDPNDADHVIVVFSNYRVYSLFYSYDGGATWTKGAGNLEGASNAGPSLRWASIIPTANGNVYLVGSSTGLYATNLLNNTSTVWMQMAPNEIGNLVVDMIDFRTSDGYVAIATHGGGMFSTTITDTLSTGIHIIDAIVSDLKVYPNPVRDKVFIEYVKNDDRAVVFRLYDERGRLVAKNLQGSQDKGKNLITYDVSTLKKGVYFIRVETGSSYKSRKILIL